MSEEEKIARLIVIVVHSACCVVLNVVGLAFFISEHWYSGLLCLAVAWIFLGTGMAIKHGLLFKEEVE